VTAAPDVEHTRVTGPAVWWGAEQRTRTDWCVQLDERHVAELLAAVAAVTGQPHASLGIDAFALPTLGPVLARCLDELVDGRGFVLLRGVPIDRLDDEQLALAHWGLGQHLGVPIPQNDAGDLLVHVRDQGLDFGDPTVRAYQTAARLDYHSDSSDLVGLLCVRPARSGGVSTIVSSAAVRNAALDRRPDLAPELLGTWWWDRRRADLADSFFQRRIFATVDDGHGQRSVSYHGRAHIESATRGPAVPALTSRQVEALDLLDDLANDPSFVLTMDFLPGDVQFLCNHAVWHARTAYVDHPEPGRRRDLLRLWLTLRAPLALPEDFRTGGITSRESAAR
jgi:hypothetical protein